MGLKIGGFDDKPDWPKMGPSLLIATCLTLAIRTAKWQTRSSESTASNTDLEREIEYAAFLAGRVFAKLVSSHPSIFPNAKKPCISRMKRIGRSESVESLHTSHGYLCKWLSLDFSNMQHGMRGKIQRRRSRR